MKVTLAPAHITIPGLALMLIVGVKLGFTTMVMALLWALAADTQVASLVSVQRTTCPFASVLELNVGLFVPCGVPSTVQA